MLAESEGVSDRVDFVTSCSTAERNELLSECLCVLYTPKVIDQRLIIPYSFLYLGVCLSQI